MPLAEDLATRGFVAKYKSGDRNHNQQQRRHREHSVVGESGAHALGIVIDPARYSCFDYAPKIVNGHPCHPFRRWPRLLDHMRYLDTG
jgi:hypothetical protein